MCHVKQSCYFLKILEDRLNQIQQNEVEERQEEQNQEPVAYYFNFEDDAVVNELEELEDDFVDFDNLVEFNIRYER